MNKTIYIFLVIALLTSNSCITSNSVQELSNDTTLLFPVSNGGKWGYVDEDGKLVINYQYDAAAFFNEGLAPVKKDNQYGYLKKDNSWFIKPQFELAEAFDKHCATVVKNGESLRINKYNKPCEISSFTVGGCIPPARAISKVGHIVSKNGKYAIVYKHYTIIENEQRPRIRRDTTNFIFDHVIEFSSQNLLIQKDGKYALFNVWGTEIPRIESEIITKDVFVIDQGQSINSLIFQYDDVELLRYKCENDSSQYEVSVAAVKVGNKWGFINSGGHVYVNPKYNSVASFNGTIALVEYLPNKTGYISLRENKEHFEQSNLIN